MLFDDFLCHNLKVMRLVSYSIFSKPLSRLALIGLVSACESLPPQNQMNEGASVAVVDTPQDTSNSPDHTVCDPFTDNASHVGSSLDLGLVASIHYIAPGQPLLSSAADYRDHATPLDATLFLSQLNIPTRAFDLGFVTQAGQLIQTPEGNTLYEYFSIHADTEIQLAPDEAPGSYQFALLADDGAVLNIDEGTGLHPVVNDDGVHPTRLGCATQAVQMSAGVTLPAHIDYYQGPRYHIALALLWREWTPDPGFNPNDVECGQAGNSRYWNSGTVPSTPQAALTGMLSRGWKFLRPENYVLPRSIRSNPCTQVQPLLTFITAHQPSGILSRTDTAQFTFSANKAGSRFECSLDGSVPAACTSPQSSSGLLDGDHRFQVWAIDLRGFRDAAGAEYRWTVDSVAPMILSVQATAARTSLTLTWTTGEAASTKLLWGTSEPLAQLVPDDGVYSTSHSVTLSGLIANTIYLFRPAGFDRAGNAVVPETTNSTRTTR